MFLLFLVCIDTYILYCYLPKGFSSGAMIKFHSININSLVSLLIRTLGGGGEGAMESVLINRVSVVSWSNLEIM